MMAVPFCHHSKHVHQQLSTVKHHIVCVGAPASLEERVASKSRLQMKRFICLLIINVLGQACIDLSSSLYVVHHE